MISIHSQERKALLNDNETMRKQLIRQKHVYERKLQSSVAQHQPNKEIPVLAESWDDLLMETSTLIEVCSKRNSKIISSLSQISSTRLKQLRPSLSKN